MGLAFRSAVPTQGRALGLATRQIPGLRRTRNNHQAGQGVFITTGRFSSGAAQYAENVPTRVALIDGARLARLMIKYRVGVQVRKTYDVVELDEDYFE